MDAAPTPTVIERDGWRWINRCVTCGAEAFYDLDSELEIGGEWWYCGNGHTCDAVTHEVLSRPSVPA